MKELLCDKTILVAGAGGLLGSSVIVAALNQGANIIAVDININAAKIRIESMGISTDKENLKFYSMDITNADSVKEIFSSIPNIDGAVNSTYPRNISYGAHYFDVKLEDFNENLALNLGGSFIFTQQCAAYFKKHKAPFSLVNISSIYGTVTPDFSIYENTLMTMPVEYAAIKSALLKLNKYVAAYVNDSGFRINSVSPGGIFDHQPEVFLDAYKKKTHGAGMLMPDDVVGAVLFLISDQSRYIVGQDIVVDDGFTI